MGAIRLIKLRFDNPKLFSLTLITAVLASSYFSYALTNNAVIHNSATISLSSITAKSGSPADIQAAVNTMAAAGGGTVYVPAGTWHWNGETVTVIGGVNVVGASNAGCQGHENNWTSYTATTILHNDHPQATADPCPPMFYVDGWDYSHKASRISGIQFEATAPTSLVNENGGGSSAITLLTVYDFRVDHCTFINFCNTAVACDANTGYHPNGKSIGVIDHCVIDNPYKLSGSGWMWAYGFYARGDWVQDAHWNNDITQFAGKYDSSNIPTGTSIMYVEDCHMSRCRHAIDAIDGGWPVVRYNLVDNSIPPYGDIEVHGATYGISARGFEAYNNTIIETNVDDDTYGNADIAFRIRGGSGLVFNNTFTMSQNEPGAYFIYLDAEGTYPQELVSQTYIWSNSYTNSSFLNNRGGFTENGDYFLRAPTMVADGFTYTPYTYPIAPG